MCNPSQPNDGCSEWGRCNVQALQCQCNGGFLGDGKACEPVCVGGNTTCSENGVSCVDLPQTSSSYACLCKEGYQWSAGGKRCIGQF